MSVEPEVITTKHRYITEVNYFPPPEDYMPAGENTMRAVVNVVIDDDFVCKDFKIFEGKKGLWVAMPADEDKNGNYHDRFFPITKEGREHIIAVILKNFAKTSVSNMSAEDIRRRAEQGGQDTSGVAGGGSWSAGSAGPGWGSDDSSDTAEESGPSFSTGSQDNQDSGWGSGSQSESPGSKEEKSSWGSSGDSAARGEKNNSSGNSDSDAGWGNKDEKSKETAADSGGWGAGGSDFSKTEQKEPQSQQSPPVAKNNVHRQHSASDSILFELIEQAGLQLLIGFVIIILIVSAVSGGVVYLFLNNSGGEKQAVEKIKMEPRETGTVAAREKSVSDLNSREDEKSSSVSAPEISESSRETIFWREAGNFIGQEKTVEGKIVGTFETSNIKILNFGRSRDDFNAIIKSKNFDKFPADIEDHYVDKKVHMTGEIATYKGNPQIVLKSPDQIEFVN